MHELAIARSIVDVSERHADGLAVTIVRVKVGRLRQVVPEYLGFNFEIAAQSTGCEGAKLECERTPALLRCRQCEFQWDPAPPPARGEQELLVGFRCPACESADHEVVSGDELVVESIDVEDPGAATDRVIVPATETGGS